MQKKEVKEMIKNETPEYYNDGNIQPIEFIEDKEFNFNLGNVVKYISRAGKKTKSRKEDLGKALYYLEREYENCLKEEEEK